MRTDRWHARAEVTYNEYGDRGSIDKLAFDPVTATLLVTELKTGIYDGAGTVAKLDEKTRYAPKLARRFGWAVRGVVPALIVAETGTNRRRVEQHERLFARFACRGRAARAWLRAPDDTASGLLLFVPLTNVRGTNVRRAGRQRVRVPRPATSVERASSVPDAVDPQA